jgi:hypothetical protein
MTTAMLNARKITGQCDPDYTWLQVAGVDYSRCLPWVCVDCRTGTIHTFANSDDARAFAASEGIEFFL